MTNRLITILLVLVTTVAICAEAGRVFMTPPDRWRDWLQLLVAQQIADELHRQVQIGPITNLSMRGVETTSLAIADGRYLEDGAVLRAARLRISFDLRAIVRGHTAPAAGISEVWIENAWAYVARDEDGVLNLERILPEPVDPPPPPEDRFHGLITIVDSTLIYDDYALPTTRGQVVNLELIGFDAEIDMRTLGWAEIVFSGSDRLGRVGRISTRGVIELETGFLSAQANLGAVDAAYWYDRLVDLPELSVAAGRVDVAAAIGVLPKPRREPDLTVAAEVAVRGADVRPAALDGRQVLADADATVTLDGLELHRLSARIDTARVEASGFVGDLDDPIVDIVFEADVPRAADFISLLPELGPEIERQLEAVSIAGPLLASGEVLGSLREANLSALVTLPGEVRYASADAGEYLATSVEMRLDLLDLSDPSLRAQADLAQAEALDLEPLRAMLPEELEGPLEVSPLEDLSADVLWSMEIPVVQTEIAIPRLAAGDLVVEDLRTEVALAGEIVRLGNLSARPLGAELTAEAVLDLGAEEGLWAWARGAIEGLSLDRVRQLPGLEMAEELSGTFSGDFAGQFADGRPLVVAQATVDRPRYQKYWLDSVSALVIVDEDAVQVRAASFEDRIATGWARGVLPFDGEMAASFGIGEVDLDWMAQRFDLEVENLTGEAFVTGSVSGTFEDPQVDATVRAFGLTVDDYGVDAVAGRIAGGMDEVVIDGLHASSGRIVARVDGRLSELDFDELDAQLAGEVTVSGPVDEHALELADLAEHDLSGALRATLDVGGTLKRPSADGAVRLDFGRYETVATDDAVLLVRLEGDLLELTDLRLPIGEALVTGEASIASLYDTPTVAANITAEDIVLQDLALWQETGVPLSGEINLPFVSLQGPLDSLSGMAQIEASDLELGNEEIGAVSATVVLDRNALMLRRTSLALAGGTMALEGQYRMEERRVLPSTVDLEDVSVARLLRIAVPLARRFADSPPQERGADEMPLSDRLASYSMRFEGRLDGTLTAQGVIPEGSEEEVPTEQVMESFLEAFMAELDLSVRDPGFDNRSLPPVMLSATLAEGTEVAMDLEAVEGDGLITAFGTWRPDGAVDALAEVSALDLAALREWLPQAVRSTGGTLNLTVQAEGTVEEPELIASLDIINPEVHGVTFDLLSAPIIRYDGDMIDVDSLVLREDEEEFYVHGLIPFDWETRSIPQDGQLQLTARADNTDIGIFPPLLADATTPDDGSPSPLAELRAAGAVNALVSITGTPVRPELTGELEIDASSINAPWLESPVEDTRLEANFRGLEGTTFVELGRLSSRYEAMVLAGSGTAEMSQYEMERLTENVYDFSFELSAPQQSFASGALTARRVRGEITFATDETDDQVLTVSELGADFGDGSILMGGTVGVTSFDFARLARNDFDLRIVADRARPRYSNRFQGTVDGTIEMSNPSPGEVVLVAGTMTISHAVLGVPRSSGEETEELQGMSADFPSPQFDVRLAIGPDVQVRTMGMAAPLQPTDRAVWARGTPQRPNIQGQIEVQEGEARLPGGALDIETAGVRFLVRPALGTDRLTPPVNLDVDGRVWATAHRTIEAGVVDGRQLGAVDIQLTVSGTLPGNIHVEVMSTPPLAEEQIYALLGTAPFQGAEGFTGSGDLEQVMTEQFVSALGAAFRQFIFQPFEEELRQLFGLSVLEVDFAFDQPVALRIGGYLVEDLLVTYQTSILGAHEGYDIAVSYRVERQYEISYRTDETSNHRLLIEYVRRF